MASVLIGLVTVAGLVIFFTEALGEGFAGETGLVGEAGFCLVVAFAFGWALSSTICFADNLS